MRSRTAAACAAALALTVGLAACGGDDDDDTTTAAGGTPASTAATGASAAKVDPAKPKVHIALVANKVPGSNLLDQYNEGAQAAADQINAAGGFGGREVVIDACNGQSTPSIVSVCAHRLVKSNPVAMIGCDVSWGVAGKPVFAKAGIPSIYCLNSPDELKDPMAFGMGPGGPGEQVAIAKWICTQPQIKTVVSQLLDLPQLRAYANFTTPVIKGCGKKISYVYLALGAADVTPVVNQIVARKPDFVLSFAQGGAQTVQVFRGLHQAGYPSDQIFTMSSSLNYEELLKPAGEAMDGVRFVLEGANMQDSANPDAAKYTAAVQGKTYSSLNSTVEQGYVDVQAIAVAGRAIGFDKLTGRTLAAYLNSTTGVGVPMSRQIINPGPAGTPQVKQPYGQLVQWQGGKLTTITDGTEEGWIKGA
jgi:branched-chain amino acid transport system substrate-binding protein